MRYCRSASTARTARRGGACVFHSDSAYPLNHTSLDPRRISADLLGSTRSTSKERARSHTSTQHSRVAELYLKRTVWSCSASHAASCVERVVAMRPLPRLKPHGSRRRHRRRRPGHPPLADRAALARHLHSADAAPTPASAASPCVIESPLPCTHTQGQVGGHPAQWRITNKVAQPCYRTLETTPRAAGTWPRPRAKFSLQCGRSR